MAVVTTDGSAVSPTPGSGAVPSARPLSGIRVADFSRVLAGPYATMMMADFGADVIKIESPAGDETRAWAPPLAKDGQSTYFTGVNRNKRSVVLDLNQEADRARAFELATTADVVIENFRPDVMAKFGLDYASVSAANPGVIFCSLTGFGSGGGKDLAGYDLLVQAMGGLMSITGQPDGEPTKAGVALVDIITGLNAFSGILLALRQRDDADSAATTGRGQHLEIDLLTSLLSALSNQASAALNTGNAPGRMGNAHPSISPYELYRAKDRDLVVAIGSDRHFALLVETLGRPELAADVRFARNPDRVAHRDELKGELEAALSQATAAEWVDRLQGVGLPVGPVNTVTEAFDLARRLGLNPDVAIDHAGASVLSVSNPIRLQTGAARYDVPAPRLGEHTDATWLEPRNEEK